MPGYDGERAEILKKMSDNGLLTGNHDVVWLDEMMEPIPKPKNSDFSGDFFPFSIGNDPMLSLSQRIDKLAEEEGIAKAPAKTESADTAQEDKKSFLDDERDAVITILFFNDNWDRRKAEKHLKKIIELGYSTSIIKATLNSENFLEVANINLPYTFNIPYGVRCIFKEELLKHIEKMNEAGVDVVSDL